MRIALIGPRAEDDFATNIADGLVELGHSPILVGSSRGEASGAGRVGKVLQVAAREIRNVGAVRERLDHRLVGVIREHEPDLVITVETLHPDLVGELRRQGIPAALWFPDHIANIDQWMFDAPYAGVFFKEPRIVESVRELLGLPVWYLPEACNPKIHRVVEAAKEPFLAVVGNMYATRLRVLERLAADGVPMRLYGGGFPSFVAADDPLRRLHTGRYVRGLEKSRTFRSAAAVLNNLHPAEVDGVNCRLFEATAAGGAVLCEDRPELHRLFEVDREVLSFESYDELLTKARQLLDNHALSTAIGDAAAARSGADHTYAVRLAELLAKV